MAIMAVALAACLAVQAASDRVLAGDLARVSESFAALDPSTVVAWAPAPGVRRVLPAAELGRIAARLGAPAAPQPELCVERKVAPLDPATVLAAIQSQAPDTEVQLLDLSRAPAPKGELAFPRSGLRRAAGGTYFWNGSVRYAGGRRFAIWAEIAVAASGPVVVAASDLKPGAPIDAAQLRLENRDGLFASTSLRSPDQAAGKMPRRLIRAGTAIAAEWLEPVPEVSRGDTVKVDLWSGSAHLQLDARAESSAPLGQPVALRNPVTQKRFFARVEGPGRVSMEAVVPVGPARNPREKP